jgi:hypothetical protein
MSVSTLQFRHTRGHFAVFSTWTLSTLKLQEKGCQVEQLDFEDTHYKYSIVEEEGNRWCEVRR